MSIIFHKDIFIFPHINSKILDFFQPVQECGRSHFTGLSSSSGYPLRRGLWFACYRIHELLCIPKCFTVKCAQSTPCNRTMISCTAANLQQNGEKKKQRINALARPRKSSELNLNWILWQDINCCDTTKTKLGTKESV